MRRSAAAFAALARTLGVVVVVVTTTLSATLPAGADDDPRARRAELLLRIAELTDTLDNTQAYVVAAQMESMRLADEAAAVRQRVRARAVRGYIHGVGLGAAAPHDLAAPAAYLEVAARKERELLTTLRRASEAVAAREAAADEAKQDLQAVAAELDRARAELDRLVAADDARRMAARLAAEEAAAQAAAAEARRRANADASRAAADARGRALTGGSQCAAAGAGAGAAGGTAGAAGGTAGTAGGTAGTAGAANTAGAAGTPSGTAGTAGTAGTGGSAAAAATTQACTDPLANPDLLPRRREATRKQAELMRRYPFGVLSPGPLPAGLAFTGETSSGLASWYGGFFNGRPTASGAIYDEEGWTAASRTLPLGTLVVVSRNGVRVLLVINDRGPYIDGRVIDLSAAAARALDVGLSDVTIEVVAPSGTA